MTDNTLLVLTGVGVPAYAARGLTQTIELIDQAAQLRRTVNGNLRDVSDARFHRYKSTITGSDQKAPAIDGVWPGRQVTVDCIAELCYPVGGIAERFIVPGSSYTEAGFVYYRPRLVMLVTSFNTNVDEWRASVRWQMVLEEV